MGPICAFCIFLCSWTRWAGGITGTLGQEHCLDFYAKVYNARNEGWVACLSLSNRDLKRYIVLNLWQVHFFLDAANVDFLQKLAKEESREVFCVTLILSFFLGPVAVNFPTLRGKEHFPDSSQFSWMHLYA